MIEYHRIEVAPIADSIQEITMNELVRSTPTTDTRQARQQVDPLNDATARLLRPIALMRNDRLRISLDDTFKHFVVQPFAVGFNGGEYRASAGATKSILRIPERRELDHWKNTWRVAATDFSVLVINAVWEPERIEFADDARTLYEFLLTRFLSQTLNSRIKAAYKVKGEIPLMPSDFIDHPQRPLMTFQRVAVSTSAKQEGANLWMEQGTGKTPIVISRVCSEAHGVYTQEKRMYRALIVVPKSMRMNWHNRFIDFATRPGKITVLRGGQLDRVKELVHSFKADEESEYTVVVCSYETVLRSWEALGMVTWDLCVLDEAHMIKSHCTKRWAKMRELREHCKCRMGLTGTPIANNLFDAFTQLEWLGEGLSGFTSYKNFKSFYGKFVKQNGQNGKGDNRFDVLIGYKNLPILQERLARLCFMISRDEAMPELPKKTYDVLEVAMTPFQRDCYVKLQKQLALEIELEMNSGTKQLTAHHILTKLLRLSQITSGFLKWDAQYDDEGNVLNANSRFEEITPNPKIEVVIELLKSKGPKEKTIIWTNWIPSIEMLSAAMTAAGIQHVLYYGGTSDDARQTAQDTYNADPNVKVFLGNPAAGGVGLDLWGHLPEQDGTDRDTGCNTTQVLYFSQGWSMIHRSQSEDRPVRRGTRVPVQITDIIVPGTIDEEIALRVLSKKMAAMQLQDIRDIMTKVLSSVPSEGDDDA